MDLTVVFKTTADQVSPYPPETVLFTALPMLCMSSPMPRIVAHPSEAETTKSNVQRSNLFFFILTSRAIRSSKHAKAITALKL